MDRRDLLTAWVLFLAMASAGLGGAEAVDAHGDALPNGACQRLGSQRLRYASLREARYLPDGQVMAFYGRTLERLDMATGAVVQRLELPLSPVSLDVAPDGATLALAGSDGTLCLADPATGQERRRWASGQAAMRCVRFSPDGQRLLSAGRMPPTLKEWDAAEGKERLALQGALTYYDSVAYGLGGTRAIAGGGYYGIEFWDLTTGTLLQSPKTGYCIYELTASPDGRRVLAAERSSGTEWDVDSMALLKRFSGHHGGAVTGQAYGVDPDEVFTGSRDGSVRRWQRHEGKVLARWFPHASYARSLQCSPDGRWLLSYQVGHCLVETAVADGTPRLSIARHTAAVEAVIWTPDGRILSGAQDGTARLWDAVTGAGLAVLPIGQSVACVAAAPDGARLAVGGKDGIVHEFDGAGQPRRQRKGHFGWVRALCYLDDGRLASAADDGTVRLWDADADTATVLEGHRGGVLALTRVDARHIASAGRDGSVRLWDIDAAREVWSQVRHHGTASCLATDGNGGLWSSGRDGRILRWTSAGEATPEAPAAGTWVRALAVQPGDGFWVGTNQPKLQSWQPDGQPRPDRAGHGAGIAALALSPNGDRLASASADGTVLIWPTHTAKP